MISKKIRNPDVRDTFTGYSPKVASRLLAVRDLIFEIAARTDEIGEIEETLKWGEPSYLTRAPKSGTTIRLTTLRSDSEKFAVCVHCQTSLVADFRQVYPELDYDGNRGLVFDVESEMPVGVVEHFIHAALTYHQRRKSGAGI